MYTKTLTLSLLILASPVMATPVYEQTSSSNSHHEATSAGVGLVAGTLIGGPFGAIIGGSIGVLAGHQQTKTETIAEQQHFITELERELEVISADLSQSKKHIKQLETAQQLTKLQYDTLQSTQNQQVKQIANSYQFDVYFLTNSNDVQSHAKQGLAKLATLLKNNPAIQANIEAHSDWRGSDEVNFQLAQQRLLSISDTLSLAGVNSSQLLSTNYGEQYNQHTNSWGEELFYDRRVTITLSYFKQY